MTVERDSFVKKTYSIGVIDEGKGMAAGPFLETKIKEKYRRRWKQWRHKIKNCVD